MDDHRPKLQPFNFWLFAICVMVISIITAISAFCGVLSVGVLLTDWVPENAESDPPVEFLSNEQSAGIGLGVGLVSSITGMPTFKTSLCLGKP